MDPSFLSGLGGFLLFIGFVAVIWFCQGWFNYTYCCGKSYNKRQFFCAVCNARVAGPCPACGKHQKWKGSGCMHCGHKLGDPVPISSPTIVRSIPNTSPSLTTISLPCCPECHSQISPEYTHCGNCGFNLEQTMVREQQ